MLYRRPSSPRRFAAVTVESAVILLPFLMVLFGILEYCRFFWVRQIAENAAREGARYAVARTYLVRESPTDNFNTITDQVQQRVIDAMGGTQQQVKNNVDPTLNFKKAMDNTSDVRVFRSTPTGTPESISLTGTKTAETVGNWANARWNRARFGDSITVQVVANYRPLFGKLLFIPDPIPLTFTSTMVSEAN